MEIGVCAHDGDLVRTSRVVERSRVESCVTAVRSPQPFSQQFAPSWRRRQYICARLTRKNRQRKNSKAFREKEYNTERDIRGETVVREQPDRGYTGYI